MPLVSLYIIEKLMTRRLTIQ